MGVRVKVVDADAGDPPPVGNPVSFGDPSELIGYELYAADETGRREWLEIVDVREVSIREIDAAGVWHDRTGHEIVALAPSGDLPRFTLGLSTTVRWPWVRDGPVSPPPFDPLNRHRQCSAGRTANGVHQLCTRSDKHAGPHSFEPVPPAGFEEQCLELKHVMTSSGRRSFVCTAGKHHTGDHTLVPI